MGRGIRQRTTHIERLERRSLLSKPPANDGLTGDYLQDLNLASTSASEVLHDRPNHTWTAGQAPAGVDPTTFSAVWNGLIRPASTNSTRFYAKTDGGVRVWIDHKLIIDDWNTLNRTREVKGSINLTKGKEVAFHVDYRHDTASTATIDVRWQMDVRAKEPIPLWHLRPNPNDTGSAFSLARRVDTALAFAKASVTQTLADLKPGAFPDSARLDTGKWSTVPATSWTSGFFGGTLWGLDKAIGGFSKQATQWTTPLASTASLPGDHFGRIWATYKPLYDKTKSSTYRDVLLKAAKSKAATWSNTVKAFQTKDIATAGSDARANFGVLMDQTMDMELLLWAADQTHDATLRGRVVQQMKTVAANMVREDGSVVQRGFFNAKTGDLISLENYQGLNNASTWARGQAWAIASFSRVAELTGDASILATAKQVADFWMSHRTHDGVPIWDFDAPVDSKDQGQPRDTSAGAIATVGLYRLGTLLGEPKAATISSTDGVPARTYRDAADALLSTLTSGKYMVYGQSVAKGVALRGILAHGASNVPKNKGVDVPLTYGDYFLIQAINAYRA